LRRIGEEKMKYLLSIGVVALVLVNAPSARAQSEVTLVAPGGLKPAIEQLIPGFESKTGYKVKATYGSGSKDRVARGEAFDVPIVQPPYPEMLASGNVVASSETPLASVALGVAVRHGAPKPDISTPEAVKRMLLTANSVSYADPASGAASAESFERALKKLAISEQMQSRLKRATNGGVAMQMVADGEADIGFTFLSEMNRPGIDVIGALPREISPPTGLVAFLSSHAKDPAAARALLDYLSSPEAAAVYKAQGMQPGR
jgi:molybdate transport system substrate-binding protein